MESSSEVGIKIWNGSAWMDPSDTITSHVQTSEMKPVDPRDGNVAPEQNNDLTSGLLFGINLSEMRKPLPVIQSDLVHFMSLYFQRWMGHPGGSSKGPTIPPLIYVPVAFVGALSGIVALGGIFQSDPYFPQIVAGAFGSQV
jgi:hypothetical protein